MKLLLHVSCTFICMILVFLKDMKYVLMSSINSRPLVPVSSLSIFALVLSFVILLVYGFVKNGIVFKASMLVPSSLVDMLSSIGVASFSLGYNFSFLSFYVQLYTSSHNIEASQTFHSSESEKSNCPLYCCNNHVSHHIAPPRISFLFIVSIMMFLSCLFTYPIYSPPLNEVLEETIKNKRTTGIFVSDPTRLMYRILQTLMISLVAWFCPFFGDIISLDILESIRLIVPSFYLVALCLQLSLV